MWLIGLTTLKESSHWINCKLKYRHIKTEVQWFTDLTCCHRRNDADQSQAAATSNTRDDRSYSNRGSWCVELCYYFVGAKNRVGKAVRYHDKEEGTVRSCHHIDDFRELAMPLAEATQDISHSILRNRDYSRVCCSYSSQSMKCSRWLGMRYFER